MQGQKAEGYRQLSERMIEFMEVYDSGSGVLFYSRACVRSCDSRRPGRTLLFERHENMLLAIWVLGVFWRQKNVRINPFIKAREATLGRS